MIRTQDSWYNPQHFYLSVVPDFAEDIKVDPRYKAVQYEGYREIWVNEACLHLTLVNTTNDQM